MNLIEVLRTGKSFTRREAEYPIFTGLKSQTPQGSTQLLQLTTVDSAGWSWFKLDELLDDNWELYEEKRQLTWAEIVRAIDDTTDSYIGDLTEMKRLLGFTE